jgi:predicted RNA-binding Zn-ribbon protein involved in translation (DUF1610 family)
VASSWGQIVVHGNRTGQFNCPHCNASYYLIETDAGPETDNVELTCVACSASLPAREGSVIFKYFLSDRAPPQREARKI